MAARRLAIVVAVAAVGAVWAPVSAFGATASSNNGNVFFFAAAGETNNLTISEEGANLVLTDPGATITPTAPCVTVTANKASCPAAGIIVVDARLGDLNDVAQVADSVTTLVAFSSTSGAIISGQAGGDQITGGRFVRNSLFGAEQGIDSPGDDTLTGGPLSDALDGGSGIDTLTGGGGGDQLTGGPGNDTELGGDGADGFTTGTAADGADVIDGGPGSDTLSFTGRITGVSVSLNGVADDGEACPGAACEGDNVTDIFTIQGGTGDDTLSGDDAPNLFNGNTGADTLVGGGGIDSLFGSDGDDTLVGGDGSDTLNGGLGVDTADGGNGDDLLADAGTAGAGRAIWRSPARRVTTGGDTYLGGAGEDEVTYSSVAAPVSVTFDGTANDGQNCPGAECEGDNVGADIEGAIGGSGDDTLVGNDEANPLDGGAGNDSLTGGGGSDSLTGGDGDDNLNAGPGADSLFGNAGVDLLRSRDDSADQVDCGAAVDTVIADSLDSPEASCEATSDGIVIAKSAKVAGDTVKLKLTCPAAEGIACKAKVKLKANGKTIASGKQKVASGETKTATLKLTDDGVKALGGSGKVHADASASFTDATGETVVTKRKVEVG